MTKRTWNVRAANASDAPGIAECYCAVMGSSRPNAHDTWKFWGNAFTPPLVMVAEDGDRIVGQYALWPTPLVIGGVSVLGAQSLDTMTHPDYQGQGMFTTLARACYALAADHGVELLYGFPNDNSYPGFIRRLNWDHTGDVDAWSRPLQLAEHPRTPRALGSFAGIATRFLPLARGECREERNVDIAELAALAERTSDNQSCRVARSAEWLAYRLAPESGHAYRAVTVRRGGDLIAAALWGEDVLMPYRKALLADVIGEEAGRAVAIGGAVSAARAWGAATMSAISSHHTDRAALKANGFFRHAAARLIVKPLVIRDWKANIHDHASWRVTGLDLDTY